MNSKRWMVILYYILYLVVMCGLAFIYQVSHPHDPPQSTATSAGIAIKNILRGQYSTLFGIVLIVIFIVWFVCCETRQRRRRR